jgi:hypothetical protein
MNVPLSVGSAMGWSRTSRNSGVAAVRRRPSDGRGVGFPGSENVLEAARQGLFHPAVYFRGAMTLHELRRQAGDARFFTMLGRWAQSQAGGTVTTDEFIALAEKVSGQELDGLFDQWLGSGMPEIEDQASMRLAPGSTEPWTHRVKGEPIGRK